MSRYYRFRGETDLDKARKMLHPAICPRCTHVHDAASVRVTARYSDCSMWNCPNCGVSMDDRPGIGATTGARALQQIAERSRVGGLR